MLTNLPTEAQITVSPLHGVFPRSPCDAPNHSPEPLGNTQTLGQTTPQGSTRYVPACRAPLSGTQRSALRMCTCVVFLKRTQHSGWQTNRQHKETILESDPRVDAVHRKPGPQNRGMRFFQKRASLLANADIKSTPLTRCHVTKSCFTEKG